MTQDEVVRGLMQILTDAETRLGHRIDWEKHLPRGKEAFSAREVCNALGAALNEAGIENNLERR